ncbi:Alg9-like mannosyltransferase family-domain-containing protein [Phlyctochytrium arcticum]|nr:Alg9-like mannosyltransferase family-domain-containing protein [Phlyctochytrium arcticum]
MGRIQSRLLSLLTYIQVLSYLVLVPFTKVEESFHLQATHDILHYGPLNLTHYDHFAFPGVVPRSFTVPVLISSILAPLTVAWPVREYGLMYQVLTRGLVGVGVAWATNRVRRAVGREFGGEVERFMAIVGLVCVQMGYWASRTVGNVFALAGVMYAMSEWIGQPRMTRRGILMLIFISAVIRCDVTPLAIFLLLSNQVSAPRPIFPQLKFCLAASVGCIVWTTLLDTYFWGHLTWPELTVLRFNTIQDGSRAYGTLPFHAYFTKLILNLAPLYWLGFWAVARDGRVRKYMLPFWGFIGLYSALPHKEWRFVMYVLPMAALATSVSLVSLLRWSSSQTQPSRTTGPSIRLIVSRLPFLILLLQFMFTPLYLHISSWNYPGAHALHTLHSHLHSLPSPPKTVNPHIHIGVSAAMTGVTNFLYQYPESAYDKTEYADPMIPFISNTSFTHLITTTPPTPSLSHTWKWISTIQSYAGISVSLPSLPHLLTNALKNPTSFGVVTGVDGERAGCVLTGWRVGGLILPLRIRYCDELYIVERIQS